MDRNLPGCVMLSLVNDVRLLGFSTLTLYSVLEIQSAFPFAFLSNWLNEFISLCTPTSLACL